MKKIPDFPYQDERTKIIALLGYTGVGKTTLITAGYFRNIIHGKDAFTKRFFQRIEEEIYSYGEIPLTLGEASTLGFIDPKSRNEFTLQDFSGEHIKLERKEEDNYQKLLYRANQADALLCLLSAESFYKKNLIKEEIDAIQTFVNRLRGLGTRIPIVVVLTKCDTVPRFHSTLPIWGSLLTFISWLPFLRLPPERGLHLTRRRFAKVFEAFDFQGMGPKTIFQGIAIPRLKTLKRFRFPKGLKWLGKISRSFFGETKWLFQNATHLDEPFIFCMQAFQVGLLRDLLVYHHEEQEYSQELLKKFKTELLEKQKLGEEFYFAEYLEEILEDTRSIIEEVDVEVKNLSQSAENLLHNRREIRQNLEIWLREAEEKIRRFHQPWSEGARQTLVGLKKQTLERVKEQLQKEINEVLENPEESQFYQIIDLIKLHHDLSQSEIWRREGILLPDPHVLKNQLLSHLVLLTLQRRSLSQNVYQKDRSYYQEVFPEEQNEDLQQLDQLVSHFVTLDKKLETFSSSQKENWSQAILPLLKDFEKSWEVLARAYSLEPEQTLKSHLEQAVLAHLEQEIAEISELSQVPTWIVELRQVLDLTQSQERLEKISEQAKERSWKLLEQEMQQVKNQAEKLAGKRKALPEALEKWYQQALQKEDRVRQIAGEKGHSHLQETIQTCIEQIKDHLDELVEKAEEGGEEAIFHQFLEILEIYQKIEDSKLLSSTPLVGRDLEPLQNKAFYYLLLTCLHNPNITTSSYQKQEKLLLQVIPSSPPANLKNLRQLIASYEEIQKIERIAKSQPSEQWQDYALRPMNEFQYQWHELASQFKIPDQTPLREEVERTLTRSLQEILSAVSLAKLRDWVNTIDPILLHRENHQALEEYLNHAESRIRKQFQEDLLEFIANCERLEETAEKEKLTREQIESAWEKFAGSFQALSYSTEKFPYSELALDQETLELYEKSAPKSLHSALEKWVEALVQQKMLRQKRAEKILTLLQQAKEILRRPQGLQGLQLRLERKAQNSRRGKRLALMGTALAFLVAAFLYLYAKQQYQHHEIVRIEAILDHVMQAQLPEKELVRLEREMETLQKLASPSIQERARQVLLELRVAQTLQQARQNQVTQKVREDLQRYQAIEQQIQKQHPLFRSYLIEDLRKVVQEKK